MAARPASSRAAPRRFPAEPLVRVQDVDPRRLPVDLTDDVELEVDAGVLLRAALPSAA